MLRESGYVADLSLGTTLFLALRLERPLLLEGEAGVGKTEVAKALAAGLGRPMIRLQCYEGLDLAHAAYEWNYPKQLIHIRAAGDGAAAHQDIAEEVFSPDFLIRRPLLDALDPPRGPQPVLLIDELDRTDEPFEAFLLEVLSDFQISIPELGTIRASTPPPVVITSNRTREIHDAVKRRCIYHWLDYPTPERELEILRSRVPEAPELLSNQVVGFVQRMRALELFKAPGVAETIDWTNALMALDRHTLDRETVSRTLGVLLKYQDDFERLSRGRRRKRARGRNGTRVTSKRGVPRDTGRLAENIAHFVRLLRGAGVSVGPGSLLTAVRAVSAVDLAHRDQFYWALHGTLISRPEDRQIFRAAFGYFWRDPYGADAARAALLSRSTVPNAPPRSNVPARLAPPSLTGEAPTEPHGPERAESAEIRMAYSARQLLRSKDFEDMTPEEMRQAKDAVRRIALRLRPTPTRRLRRSSVAHRADLRRTLAWARRTGGDPIRLQWRAPVTRPPSIVILCDVSGSMESYVRILLHFFHGLTNSRPRIHTFLFGTRLSNVTRLLRGKDVDRALARIGSDVTDWYGGTRIGAALSDFNRLWSRRVLGQGAVVLLVTDGLDREGGSGIGDEAARLQRSCRRLVWLNPLLRYEGFEPKAAGIRSLLPHVDEHRRVHNLDSLEALADSLSGTL